MVFETSPMTTETDLRAEAIEGWMSRQELEWLSEQASRCNLIVEIGVWRGRSTMAICDSCPGLVIAIDHFRGNRDQQVCRDAAEAEDLFAIARKNLSEHIDSRRLVLKAIDSRDAIAILHRDVGRTVDMVFIDGGHDFDIVLGDIQNYRKLIKEGGMICGHDLNEDGVFKAVELEFPDGFDNPVGSIWSVQL